MKYMGLNNYEIYIARFLFRKAFTMKDMTHFCSLAQASRWVSKKKKVFKKARFYRKRLKKICRSQDLASKICRQMQRYSLWSGLVTWRQGFSHRFVFLGFFFYLENFDVGQDGAKLCDAPRRTVCGGCGRAPHTTGGSPGSSPRSFFANISSEKGIIVQF